MNEHFKQTWQITTAYTVTVSPLTKFLVKWTYEREWNQILQSTNVPQRPMCIN